VGTVVALGSGHVLDGFALAGASVVNATTDDNLVRAWEALGEDVGLVILSTEAARILDSHLQNRPDVLTVVVP
jgi:vacuolar-type H+-ATPase subunit F/Vma7